MMEWKEVKLGDVIDFMSGGTPNKQNADYWNGTIPWISAKTMYVDYISTSDLFISKEGLQKGSKLAPVGTILLLTRGSGLFNNIPVCKVAKPVAFNQDVKCLFSKDENVLTNDFLFYWLYGNKLTISGILETTGIGAGKIDTQRFLSLPLNLPNLEEQKKLVNFAASIMRKIETNNKINANLEEMAQAIFKNWFVDFAPFKDGKFVESELGMIPEGWRVGNITDIDVLITDYVSNGSFASLKENVRLYESPNFAQFIRNTDLKANTFSVYVDEKSYNFLSKSALFGNEIIISNVGDVGSVFLCPKLDIPMTLGNNIIMLRPEKSEYTYYLYLWYKYFAGQALMQGIKGGSAQPKFNKTDFKKLPFLLPPFSIVEKTNALFKSLFIKVEANKQEISRLASLRDTLLPRLMSGEIEV